MANEPTTAENALLTEPPVGPWLASSAGPLADVFGRYRILDRLGEGGMGSVYLAEQDSPARKVALKVIRPGKVSPSLVQRFRLESQILGWLQHPNVAAVYEAGEADTPFGTQPYFAMEYVAGTTLSEYVRSRSPADRDKLELFVRICDGVAHAHGRGVIHRDLKPGNVIVADDGTPKVVDFGVARVTDPEAQVTLQTDIGQIVGTLSYMAPEQSAGDPTRVGPPVDVYALGVILYELLAGELPLDLRGKPVPAALDMIQNKEPQSLDTHDRRFTGDLSTICEKALQKDPGRRYDSAAALADDVRRHLTDQPIIARPTTNWYLVNKFVRRNRPLVTAGAVAAVALIAGAGVAVYGLLEARRAAETATAAANDARTEAARADGAAADARRLLAEQTFARAELLRRRGEHREAVAAYRDALTYGYPDAVRVQIRVARSLNDLGDYAAANGVLTDVFARNDLGDAEGEVLFAIAIGQLFGGATFDGGWEPRMRRSLELRLPADQAELARGLLSPKATEAMAHLTRAVELDGANADAYMLLGIGNLFLGKFAEADRSIFRAGSLRPVSVDVAMLEVLSAQFQQKNSVRDAALARLTKLHPKLGKMYGTISRVMQNAMRPGGTSADQENPIARFQIASDLLSLMSDFTWLSKDTGANTMFRRVGELPLFRGRFASVSLNQLIQANVTGDAVALEGIYRAWHEVFPSGYTAYGMAVAAHRGGRMKESLALLRESAGLPSPIDVSAPRRYGIMLVLADLYVDQQTGKLVPARVPEVLAAARDVAKDGPITDTEPQAVADICWAVAQCGDPILAAYLGAGYLGSKSPDVTVSRLAIYLKLLDRSFAEADRLAEIHVKRYPDDANGRLLAASARKARLRELSVESLPPPRPVRVN